MRRFPICFRVTHFLFVIIILFSSCSNSSREKAKKYPQLKESFDSLHAHALVLYHQGNSDSVNYIALRLMNLAEQAKDDSFLMASFKLLGNSSMLYSDYASAIDYYLQALDRDIDHERLMPMVIALYNNIGDNYNHVADREEAMNYFRMAERLIQSGKGNAQVAVYVYENIAETFLFLGKIDSSVHYLRLAEDSNSRANDEYMKPAIFIAYAQTLERSQDEQDRKHADLYYQQALTFAAAKNDSKHLANAYKRYSSFLFDQNDLQGAKNLSWQGLNISVREKYKENVAAHADLLSKIYIKQHGTDSALYYILKKDSVGRLIFNDKNNSQLKTIIVATKIKTIEEEARRTKEKREQRSNVILGIAAIGLVTLLIVILLVGKTEIIPVKKVAFLGDLNLLLFFEVINLLLHPRIEAWTDHNPLYMLFGWLIISVGLVKFHHYIERAVEKKLQQKKRAPQPNV